MGFLSHEDQNLPIVVVGRGGGQGGAPFTWTIVMLVAPSSEAGSEVGRKPGCSTGSAWLGQWKHF